jgi:molecular chaperone DnaK (HSP70)
VRLGIDFGTTRSIVAYADRGNYPVVSFIGDSGDAMDWYPSIVAERSGEFRYGLDAVAVSADPTWTVVRSFKRVLADPDVSTFTQIQVGTSRIPIGQLLSEFLAALRHDILNRSNLPKNLVRKKGMRAAIATPAHAHSTQRFLTLDAFRRAGFETVALLNEPSAAGLEYTHRHRSTITSRREYVVVYDLGGGTFDASLVRMSGQHHDVITTAGVGRLGGDDFDAQLVELVLQAAKLSRAQMPARALYQLGEQCRQVKEALNPNTRRISIDLESLLGTAAPVAEVSIQVADFYDACSPLIDRTIDTMQPVMARIESEAAPTATEDSELSAIAGIYVVGGASALPAVGRVLKKQFGRRVHRSPYPSAATAIGLAIAADETANFELTDRFSRTFGVFREAQAGAQVSFDPIFTRDVRLPGSSDDPFVSCRLYRPAHNIGHFRYVECASLDVDGTPDGDIMPFADVFFPFDPALRSEGADLRSIRVERTETEGRLVRERYALDSHGIVEVTITDLDDGFESVHKLCS